MAKRNSPKGKPVQPAPEEPIIKAQAAQNDEKKRRLILVIAGMSATLLSLGTRAASELGRGRMEQILIKGNSGYVVMAEAASGTLLIVLTTQEAKLGLIFLEMKRAIGEFKRFI